MQYALSITIDPILCRMYEIDLTSSLLFEPIALKSFRTQISTKVLCPLSPADFEVLSTNWHQKVTSIEQFQISKTSPVFSIKPRPFKSPAIYLHL